jgi:hypothetical protein
MDGRLIEQMKALLEEAYRAGLRDGAARMRNAIMHAARVPEVDELAESVGFEHHEERERRAPRGLLRDVIRDALTARPGMTEMELQDAVRTLDARVSPRSVGGELRRRRGIDYRQEGRRWFLISSIKEGAGPSVEAPPATRAQEDPMDPP